MGKTTSDQLRTSKLNMNEGSGAYKHPGGWAFPEPPKEKVEEARRYAQSLKKEKVSFELSERQSLALNAPDQILLYGGAKGGGKSWWLCVWVFLQAVKYKGNKVFFCRRRSVDFTNTTLETWKKVIPSHLYKINEQKKKISIPLTGSTIDYGGLDDPLLIQSLNSAEYGAIGVDQAEETEKDSFAMLRGTLRHRLTDGKEPNYHIRLTANPAQCWLKEDFILSPKKGFRFVPALPTDNPYLPKSYVENLREAFQHRPALLAAYLHGSWDDFSGNDICIQGKWIEEARKKPFERPMYRVVVNDPSRFGDDENVIMVMERTQNSYYEVDRVIMQHKSTMETAGRLMAMRKKHNANLIAVDTIGIGAGVVDALNELGENVLSISSSNKPTSEHKHHKYYNLRSQMWMEAGELFAQGKILLPNPDSILEGQLGSIRFSYKNGRLLVESKEDIKEKLGRSPDRADCFVMGIYALNQAKRLDHEEYENKITDRSGQGTLVTDEVQGHDFSGYGSSLEPANNYYTF